MSVLNATALLGGEAENDGKKNTKQKDNRREFSQDLVVPSLAGSHQKHNWLCSLGGSKVLLSSLLIGICDLMYSMIKSLFNSIPTPGSEKKLYIGLDAGPLSIAWHNSHTSIQFYFRWSDFGKHTVRDNNHRQ